MTTVTYDYYQFLRAFVAEKYAHRDTVGPHNAFEHFGKLNQRMVQWRHRADQILSSIDSPARYKIERWHKENGGHAGNPKGHALKLLEECLELCVACGATYSEMARTFSSEMNKANDRSELGQRDDNKIGDELADIQALVYIFAMHSGKDPDTEILKKLPVLEERQWQPDEDGVLRRPR